MLGEHLSDIKESYSKAGGSGEDAAAKKAEWVKAVRPHSTRERRGALFFTFAASCLTREPWPRLGPAAQELGGWLDKLEAVVALTGTKAGFSVGESLSLADIQLYSWASMFDGFNDGANKPAFDAELAKRPKLSAVVDAVAAHDGVKAWVAKRPQTKW